jgi:hypothetical protein
MLRFLTQCEKVCSFAGSAVRVVPGTPGSRQSEEPDPLTVAPTHRGGRAGARASRPEHFTQGAARRWKKTECARVPFPAFGKSRQSAAHRGASGKDPPSVRPRAGLCARSRDSRRNMQQHCASRTLGKTAAGTAGIASMLRAALMGRAGTRPWSERWYVTPANGPGKKRAHSVKENLNGTASYSSGRSCGRGR